MKKSLLKLAIIAVVVGGLPKIGSHISHLGGEGIKKKYIPVGCYTYADHLNRSTVTVCGNEALEYNPKQPTKFSITEGVYIDKINDKLNSFTYEHIGYIDKNHGVSVPSSFYNGGSRENYAIAIYSKSSDTVFRTIASQSISVTTTVTTGQSFSQSFTITKAMNVKAKSLISEVDVKNNYSSTRTTSYYYETSVSTNHTDYYERTTINGKNFPWCLKKFAVYMPVRFEEYSSCTVSTCGLAKGSYISKVSYKLLQIEEEEVAQVYKESVNSHVNYYFHSSQGGQPLLLDDCIAYSGMATGYIDKLI